MFKLYCFSYTDVGQFVFLRYILFLFKPQIVKPIANILPHKSRMNFNKVTTLGYIYLKIEFL